MSATSAAAFRAYFSRSALLDIRGTGSAWIIWFIVMLACFFGRQGGDNNVAFWAVVAGMAMAQQYVQFLHRLTGGDAASLIPGYRRAQWRAFTIIIAIDVICTIIPFSLSGLGFTGAAAVAILVVGISVWSSVKFSFGIVALIAAAGILVYGGAAGSVSAMVPYVWLRLAGATLPGLVALGDAGRHYLNGGAIAIGAKFDKSATRTRKSGMGVDWHFLADMNHWLFDRLLRRPATARNQGGRLAGGSYTPIWSSGSPALVLYFVCAGFIWAINAGAAWLVHGDAGGQGSIAILVGFLMVSLTAAQASATQFRIQRRQWPQYWLAVPAAGRRAWTHKLAHAFLLVQARCFVAAAAGLVVLATVVGYAEPFKISLALAVGLDIFLLVSAIALIMLPLAGRLGLIGGSLVYGSLVTATGLIGVVIAFSFGGALPLVGQLAAGLTGVGVWSVLLIFAGLRRLPSVELAVRDAGALSSLYGF